ncbi:hypothetical protein CAPTEDRAFT_152360 [Capitella teleta]|uniref:EF-hand domain-containing protein n=1 Tax=Capitella teleta TaxID=283909 RepID=R7UV13_CAPTE|nr:hypothetical protein CAPTEDRAFT_152360 [Capitella teleta]|eukprot:ELU09983.1 hypothetical protein CAPTEDRAFT_152360 [Capitella teleta]
MWNQGPPQGQYAGGPPSATAPTAGYGGGAYGAPPPAQAPGYAPQGAPQRPPQGAPQGYGSYAPPPQGQAPPGGYAPPPQNQHRGYAPQPQGQPGGYGGGYAPQGGYPGGYAPPPPACPPGISPELWGWFQSVDADHSGKITATELRQALVNGNWSPFNPETCRLMISMFDRDKDGTINAEEFAALWKYIQDWKQCFDRFDTDRSGNISAHELSQAFRAFGYNLSGEFCAICMRVFNRNDRNSINFDDFIQCSVMLKGLTDSFRQKDTKQQGVIQIQYEEFLKMALDHI